MPTEIVTIDDLKEFRIQLLEDLENLLRTHTQAPRKKWLKSFEVMTMLNITKNTLTTHRNNGVLYGKKVGGTYYYAYQEIMELLQKNNQ